MRTCMCMRMCMCICAYVHDMLHSMCGCGHIGLQPSSPMVAGARRGDGPARGGSARRAADAVAGRGYGARRRVLAGRLLDGAGVEGGRHRERDGLSRAGGVLYGPCASSVLAPHGVRKAMWPAQLPVRRIAYTAIGFTFSECRVCGLSRPESVSVTSQSTISLMCLKRQSLTQV